MGNVHFAGTAFHTGKAATGRTRCCAPPGRQHGLRHLDCDLLLPCGRHSGRMRSSATPYASFYALSAWAAPASGRIARVLFNLGYRISGSDLSDSPTLHRLQALGIATYLGHAAARIEGADAWSRPRPSRPTTEVLAAREKKIPVVRAPSMLAELMRLKQGIAIAGTHGKTTTTSLVTSVLAEAGLDQPS